jgi:hypothetical protein
MGQGRSDEDNDPDQIYHIDVDIEFDSTVINAGDESCVVLQDSTVHTSAGDDSENTELSAWDQALASKTVGAIVGGLSIPITYVILAEAWSQPVAPFGASEMEVRAIYSVVVALITVALFSLWQTVREE